MKNDNQKFFILYFLLHSYINWFNFEFDLTVTRRIVITDNLRGHIY